MANSRASKNLAHKLAKAKFGKKMPEEKDMPMKGKKMTSKEMKEMKKEMI